MRNEIEALLRAVDAREHDSACTVTIRGWSKSICDCGLDQLEAAAADVRAELAPKPVPDGELLPCPFCGCEKLKVHSVPNTGGNIRFVWCSQCNAHGPWERDDIVERWNRRAELAREPVELSDVELRDAYVRGYDAGINSNSYPNGRHYAGLRAVARAARGESK